MNHYEKGRHTPDYTTLKRIAEELDVPVAYFFSEDEISAELICLIAKLRDKEKLKLIQELTHSESVK